MTHLLFIAWLSAFDLSLINIYRRVSDFFFFFFFKKRTSSSRQDTFFQLKSNDNFLIFPKHDCVFMAN